MRIGLASILVSAAVITASCSAIPIFSPYPTDRQMEERFKTNRDDFETLLSLFSENVELVRVDKNGEGWVDFDKRAALSTQRVARYRELLSQLGIQRIERFGTKPNDVYMQVWWIKNGLFFGSKSKYYFYSQNRPEGLEASLDSIYQNGRDSNDYRHLEGNWYLYLDVW